MGKDEDETATNKAGASRITTKDEGGVVGSSLDTAKSEIQRAKRLVNYPKAKQERQKQQQQTQQNHPANNPANYVKSKTNRGLRKNKADQDVGAHNSATIRDNPPMSLVSESHVSTERKTFPTEKFRPVLSGLSVSRERKTFPNEKFRPGIGTDQGGGMDLEISIPSFNNETSPEHQTANPLDRHIGFSSVSAGSPPTAPPDAPPPLPNVPDDLERQNQLPESEVSPHMVEATLVTENSAANLASDLPISEAEIVTERSFWYKCAPKSERGQLFCGVAFLALAGIASTGIICESGACSATDNVGDNEEVEFDPEVYNPTFVNLPEYTVESLTDPFSPQAKAYRWLEASAENYALATKPEWRKHQLFGLATLFYSMGGEKWSKRLGWLDSSFDECDWAQHDPGAIGCVDYRNWNNCLESSLMGQNLPCEIGILTSLQLSGFLSGGTIPPEVELLSSLQTLVLENATWFGDEYPDWSLVDVLPKQITSLPAFTHLSLHGNYFNGEIPTSIGLASNLSFLSLKQNQLNGSLPSEIGRLASLQYLDLSHNNLEGAPSEIGLLSGLQHFTLSSNELLGLPSGVGLLSDLQHLNLSSNNFENLPSEISNLWNLKLLDLSSNLLLDIPSEVGLLPQIQQLDLSANRLRGVPSQIGLLSDLQHLDLSSNNLESLPTELGMLSNLQHLDLDFNHHVGLPSQLGILSLITNLDPFSNLVLRPSSIPAELSNITYLVRIPFQFLPSEIGLLTSLTSVQLYGWQLKGQIPSELGLLPKLESLYLYSNQLSPVRIGLDDGSQVFVFAQ